MHAEVPRAGARVLRHVPGRGARELAARVPRLAGLAANGPPALRLVERVLAGSGLELNGLGVVAQVPRGDQYARIFSRRPGLRVLRVLRLRSL